MGKLSVTVVLAVAAMAMVAGHAQAQAEPAAPASSVLFLGKVNCTAFNVSHDNDVIPVSSVTAVNVLLFHVTWVSPMLWRRLPLPHVSVTSVHTSGTNS